MNIEQIKEMVAKEIHDSFLQGYRSGSLNALGSLEATLLMAESNEFVLLALDLIRSCKDTILNTPTLTKAAE